MSVATWSKIASQIGSSVATTARIRFAREAPAWSQSGCMNSQTLSATEAARYDHPIHRARGRSRNGASVNAVIDSTSQCRSPCHTANAVSAALTFGLMNCSYVNALYVSRQYTDVAKK